MKDYLSGYVYIPLHLSAPENVFLLIHVDGEVLVFALLDGIRPGCDGSHLVKLNKIENERIFFKWSDWSHLFLIIISNETELYIFSKDIHYLQNH